MTTRPRYWSKAKVDTQHLAWLLTVLTLAACSGLQESTTSASQQGSTTVLARSTTLTTTAPTTEPSVSVQSTEPTAVTPAIGSRLDPGTYYVDPDGLPSTATRVEFTIAESGWVPLVGAYKSSPVNGVDYVAVKFLAITHVASAACDSTVWVPVGDSAEDLATGLGAIGDFVTQVASTTVTAYGYDGYHMVLEVPDLDYFPGQRFSGCDDGYFDGYEGPTFSRYYQGPHQVVEFWVLDVEGSALLIEATWFPESPAEQVAELRAILNTIVIRP